MGDGRRAGHQAERHHAHQHRCDGPRTGTYVVTDGWAGHRSILLDPAPSTRRYLGCVRQRAVGTLRSVARDLWCPTLLAFVERMETSWPIARARRARTVQLSLPPSAVNGS